MTTFRVGSTLLAGLLLAVAPARGQQPDSTSGTRSSWVAYAGYGEGSHFLAGAQLLLRTPVPAITLVPEAAIAHGASLLAGAGLHLAPAAGRVRPYAGLSLGYFWEGNDDDATNAVVFTPKAGLLIDSRKLRLMLEYQGVDWFEQSRFLVGGRWPL
jgi:hypothetical protein